MGRDRLERGSQGSNLEPPVLETGALANCATAPEAAILDFVLAADVAELADAPALGAVAERPWGFESLRPHQLLHASARRSRLPRRWRTSSCIHPNRDKAESKATKAAVILLLLTSAALIAIITVGGWSQLQGAQIVAFAYVVVYLVMAFFVARWNRGVLPVAAALAILFAVVAAVAGPAWFDRDKAGFDDPLLEPSILGLLTLILVPVQILLIAFAMRGFQQEWNVEVEVAQRRGRGPHPATGRQPAASPARPRPRPSARWRP